MGAGAYGVEVHEVAQRVRAAQKVALAVVDAELVDGVQFTGGLDALCDDFRVGRAGEVDQRPGQCLARGVGVDAGCQHAVKFDQVRREFEDVGQASEPGTGVIDRQPGPGRCRSSWR